MASLFFGINPDGRPSSPTLLPRGEKGADHGAPHRHPTVGCNKRSAVHHMADPPHPQPFSREGRRGHTTDVLAQTRSPFAPCHDPAFSHADTVLWG